MKKKRRRRVDINLPQLDEIIDSSAEKTLSEAERETLKTAIHAMADALTPRPRTTEKTQEVVEGAAPAKSVSAPEKPPPPGHGRNGAAAFTGARRVQVANQELTPGGLLPGLPSGEGLPPQDSQDAGALCRAGTDSGHSV